MRTKRFLFGALIAVMAVSVACNITEVIVETVEDPTTPPSEAVPTVSVSVEQLNLSRGNQCSPTGSFTVIVTGVNSPTLANVVSSDTTVATVSVSGLTVTVTSVGAGQATVTGSVQGHPSLTFSVLVVVGTTDCVNQPQCTVTSFSPTVSSVSLTVGQTRQITPNLTTNPANCGSVAYTASGSVVVSETGLVTGVTLGIGTVTVTPVLPSGNGQPVTLTFNVSSTSSVSITFSPQSACFSTIAGSVTTRSIAVTTSGMASGTSVSVSSSNTSLVTVSPSSITAPSGNVTLTFVGGTATGDVIVTASGGGTSNTLPTQVIATPCPGSSSSISYGPTSTSGASGTTTTLTASCTQGSDVSGPCVPYWTTNNSTAVLVVGSDSVLVNGVWRRVIGMTADLVRRTVTSTDSAEVCAHWSRTETAIRFCRTHVVTP